MANPALEVASSGSVRNAFCTPPSCSPSLKFRFNHPALFMIMIIVVVIIIIIGVIMIIIKQNVNIITHSHYLQEAEINLISLADMF
jgi:hypothetical protein